MLKRLRKARKITNRRETLVFKIITTQCRCCHNITVADGSAVRLLAAPSPLCAVHAPSSFVSWSRRSVDRRPTSTRQSAVRCRSPVRLAFCALVVSVVRTCDNTDRTLRQHRNYHRDDNSSNCLRYLSYKPSHTDNDEYDATAWLTLGGAVVVVVVVVMTHCHAQFRRDCHLIAFA